MLVKIGLLITHCAAISRGRFDLYIRIDRIAICTAQYYDLHLILRWIFYPLRCMRRCRHTVCWSPYYRPNPPPLLHEPPGGLHHLLIRLLSPRRGVDALSTWSGVQLYVCKNIRTCLKRNVYPCNYNSGLHIDR